MWAARAASFASLLIAVFFAGCVDSAGDPAATSSSSFAPAPEATVTADTGSLTGTVVNEEQLPLPGVLVALVQPGLETQTDQSGSYTFNDVEPGTYMLIFARAGFEQGGRKVDIVAGEVMHANMTLKSLVINVGYQYTIPKTSFLKLGQWTVNHVQQALNQSAINSQLCDNCWHVIEVPRNVTAVLTEPMWIRSTTAPNVNEWLGIGMSQSYGDGQLSSYFIIKDFTNRERYEWGEPAVKAIKTTPKFRMNIQGPGAGHPGLMFQQKIDVWLTFGIHQPIDANFTALPPQ